MLHERALEALGRQSSALVHIETPGRKAGGWPRRRCRRGARGAEGAGRRGRHHRADVHRLHWPSPRRRRRRHLTLCRRRLCPPFVLPLLQEEEKLASVIQWILALVLGSLLAVVGANLPHH